jgi:hypothetical protein
MITKVSALQKLDMMPHRILNVNLICMANRLGGWNTCQDLITSWNTAPNYMQSQQVCLVHSIPLVGLISDVACRHKKGLSAQPALWWNSLHPSGYCENNATASSCLFLGQCQSFPRICASTVWVKMYVLLLLPGNTHHVIYIWLRLWTRSPPIHPCRSQNTAGKQTLNNNAIQHHNSTKCWERPFKSMRHIQAVVDQVTLTLGWSFTSNLQLIYL